MAWPLWILCSKTCELIELNMHLVAVQLLLWKDVFIFSFFLIFTVSTADDPQEEIHVKIHPGVTSNLLFPRLRLQPPLTVRCIMSQQHVGSQGGSSFHMGPCPASWLQANRHHSFHLRLVVVTKKAASLSMKQFEPVNCRLPLPSSGTCRLCCQSKASPCAL